MRRQETMEIVRSTGFSRNISVTEKFRLKPALRTILLPVVVFGLLFLTLGIFSRTIDAARYFQATPLSPAQTQADFDLLQKALEEAHTGLYRYLSKPEMDRVFT